MVPDLDLQQYPLVFIVAGVLVASRRCGQRVCLDSWGFLFGEAVLNYGYRAPTAPETEAAPDLEPAARSPLGPGAGRVGLRWARSACRF